MAARDGDYAAMTWYPPDERLARWRELYCAVARGNGGEPDAGRRLRSWALRAGFTDVTSSASAWCFASPGDRAWWASTWADRMTASSLADQVVDRQLGTREDLATVAQGFREWAARDDGWFAVLHGEVLCRG
ncbi:MAG: hypothetical protein ACM3ZF_01810 [Mycobacterium leprae]